MIIIDHTTRLYIEKLNRLGNNKHNGAYYYSKEIVENIIPNVRTDRNWITVNLPGVGLSHSIVWVHNNLHPHRYNWLTNYNDVILVCSIHRTQNILMKTFKNCVYVPLSIDVNYVSKFKCEKTKDTAYAGRPGKHVDIELGDDVDILSGMPREELLSEMAKYRNIYAVGRVALEAKVLGCNILPCDKRYPDPSIWKVVDNSEAANILQYHLDRIDGGAI